MLPLTLPALIGMLIAGAATQAAPADRRGACQLLTPEDIRSVQETPAKDARASVDYAKGLEYAQCVFATADFVRSVSVTLISGGADSTRTYWNGLFHPQRSEAALKAALRKKELPRAVAGVGEEAFWTGDSRAGALYVLEGGKILRISVGGVADEAERLRRSRTLASAALQRIASK